MASNKKPRKKYSHKPIGIPAIIPMASIVDAMPDMPFHLYRIFDAALENPTIGTVDALGQAIVSLAAALSYANRGASIRDKTDAASLAIKSAIRAYEDIDKRADRTGALAINDTEALTLRNAAGQLEVALKRIPALVWNRAMADAEQTMQRMARERMLEAA